MTHKAIAARQHTFTATDKLFLDANIWLSLYWPGDTQHFWTRIYSKVFQRILDAKSQIYIDVLLLSEFMNAYARQHWRLAESRPSFKQFRKSAAFEPIAKRTADAIQEIMGYCTPVESNFTTLEIDNLLTDYVSGDYDFNDQVITHLCKTNDLTLVTNDSDFKTDEIPILTANYSLLR